MTTENEHDMRNRKDAAWRIDRRPWFVPFCVWTLGIVAVLCLVSRDFVLGRLALFGICLLLLPLWGNCLLRLLAPAPWLALMVSFALPELAQVRGLSGSERRAAWNLARYGRAQARYRDTNFAAVNGGAPGAYAPEPGALGGEQAHTGPDGKALALVSNRMVRAVPGGEPYGGYYFIKPQSVVPGRFSLFAVPAEYSHATSCTFYVDQSGAVYGQNRGAHDLDPTLTGHGAEWRLIRGVSKPPFRERVTLVDLAALSVSILAVWGVCLALPLIYIGHALSVGITGIAARAGMWLTSLPFLYAIVRIVSPNSAGSLVASPDRLLLAAGILLAVAAAAMVPIGRALPLVHRHVAHNLCGWDVLEYRYNPEHGTIPADGQRLHLSEFWMRGTGMFADRGPFYRLSGVELRRTADTLVFAPVRQPPFRPLVVPLGDLRLSRGGTELSFPDHNKVRLRVPRRLAAKLTRFLEGDDGDTSTN